MSVRGAVAGVIEANPLGRKWLEGRRLERRRRDWSTAHRARFGSTRLSIFTTVGLGDTMVARQVAEEFERSCESYGDPKLGHIVIVAGAWPLEFQLPRGDRNVYWWWSMNGREDWLETYLDRVNVKPDVVACLSQWCMERARRAGAKPLYLPLAAGEHFRALGVERSGVGYAGSKGHKDAAQVAAVIGPFESHAQFEWASGFTSPLEINAFYNRKQIVLGMTETYQERAGMVNNRVFETLASGTPFILHRHRALDEVLGQPYAYQSGGAEETRALAEKILGDYAAHLAVFEGLRRVVDERHRYRHRWRTLIDCLGEKS